MFVYFLIVVSVMLSGQVSFVSIASGPEYFDLFDLIHIQGYNFGFEIALMHLIGLNLHVEVVVIMHHHQLIPSTSCVNLDSFWVIFIFSYFGT